MKYVKTAFRNKMEDVFFKEIIYIERKLVEKVDDIIINEFASKNICILKIKDF